MVFEFSGFRLIPQLLELRGPNGPVQLEPKNFALLKLLIEERHRAIPKSEIFETIWPEVFVTDASLSTAIRQVRRAVGDSGERQSVIRTLRGHGFRFVAEVTERADAASVQAVDVPDPREPVGQLPSSRPTIAVRPFQLIGGNDGHRAIAEAIPAELIATLSKLRWIKVIARGSSFQFPALNNDLADMATQLGSQFVVTGLVEHQGRDIAIATELSDMRSGEVIWTDRISGKLANIFDMRAQIARNLAIAMEVRLPMHEAGKLDHAPSGSIDAWGLYHLGVRHMYRYNTTDNEVAANYFSRALALDPAFPRALAGLSYTDFQNAFQHFKPDTAHHRNLALRHAEEAVKHDPLDPFCNLIYGRAKWLQGQAEDGLVWVNNAIAANPNYAFGYYNRATLHNVLCNSELAEENVATAIELSPIDPSLQSMLGTRALAAFLSDDLAAATKYADRSVNAPNPHLYVHIIAALIYAQTGATDRAAHCVEIIRSKNFPSGKADFLVHYNLRDAERRQRVRGILDQLGL